MRRDVGGASSPAVRVRGPLVLLALTVLPVGLWLGSGSIADRFAGSYRSLTSVAVILAYAGTAAFALNLVLGARLRPVAALFGGLDRMYRAHRWNGQLAFVLLLGPRRPHACGAGDDLGRERARPARPWCGLDGLRRRPRVLGTDGRDRAHALRSTRARGLRLRPALLRCRLHPGRLPRARDEGLDARLRRADRLPRRPREPRTRRLRLPLGVRLRARAATALPGRVREPAGRARHGDRHARRREGRSSTSPASSSSSPSPPCGSGRSSSRCAVRCSRSGRARSATSSTRSRSPPRPASPRCGSPSRPSATTRVRCASSSRAPRPSSRGRSVSSRTEPWRIRGRSGSRAGSASRRSSPWPARLAPGDGLDVDFYYCVEHEAEAHFLDELRAIEADARRFQRHARPARPRGLAHRQATRGGARRPCLRRRARLRPARDDREPAHAAPGRGPPARTVPRGGVLVRERRRCKRAGAPSPGRRRATRRRDGRTARLIALLAALAFAALTFAFGLAVGGTL